MLVKFNSTDALVVAAVSWLKSDESNIWIKFIACA